MRRMHLFEFEDLHWLPPSLRLVITDMLSFFIGKLKIYDVVLPHLEDLLSRVDNKNMLDLCTGSGGPALSAYAHMNSQAWYQGSLTLSDKYIGRQKKNCEAVDWQQIDVLNYSADDERVRTIFSAFHHFPPAEARTILAQAEQAKAPIAVFEFTERSWSSLLLMLVGLPLIFLASPFIRPFRWSRLFWVYLLPLAPIVLLWDGLVSALRSYRPHELQALTKGLDGFHWESGYVQKHAFHKVTYLIGRPQG